MNINKLSSIANRMVELNNLLTDNIRAASPGPAQQSLVYCRAHNEQSMRLLQQFAEEVVANVSAVERGAPPSKPGGIRPEIRLRSGDDESDSRTVQREDQGNCGSRNLIRRKWLKLSGIH